MSYEILQEKAREVNSMFRFLGLDFFLVDVFYSNTGHETNEIHGVSPDSIPKTAPLFSKFLVIFTTL